MDFIVDFLIDCPEPYRYLGIFVILLACGLGVPVPEDVTLIAAGVMAYYGLCDIWKMIAVGLAGVFIGDTFVFYLGHHYGRRLLKIKPFSLFLDESKIEEIRGRLQGHSGKVLFTSRFMPGVRSTIFFSAGMLHVPYFKLVFFDGAAMLISVPTIIYSVYYFGDYLEEVIRFIKKIEGGIVGVIAVVIAVLLLNYYRKKKKLEHVETNK